jgi:predicted acyltransferase
MTCVSTDAQPRTPISNRIEGLDAFRGATVAAMLLVNNPGTWNAIWWPLEHAEWHGWTPTDLIFPFFLFVVGVTTELSRKDPWPILKRGLLIILFGLLLNAFPFFWWGAMPDATFLERIAWRLDHLRFMGVLQRIGIVYIISAFIARAFESSTYQMPKGRIEASAMRRLGDPRIPIVSIAVAILIVYWFALGFAPLEPPEVTVAAQVDRALIGTDHIWSSTKTWDPEGVLSTIPAVATALLGIVAARWVRAAKVKELTIAGVLGIAGGLLWGRVFPINKGLWTSSYVVLTAGFACVVLALFIWIVDVKRQRTWARPFIIFGLNPLLAFVGSGVMARLLSIIKINGVSLQVLSYRTLFEPFFEPHFGSFLWALSFVLVWLAILWVLYRRGIAIRV